MAAANIVTLTDASFEAEVLKSELPVLVDFWAEWCGPCKMLAPVLDELASDYEGRLKVAKVNIDDHPKAAADFGIRAIPTVLFFRGGQVAEQMVGMKGKRDIKAIIDRLVS